MAAWELAQRLAALATLVLLLPALVLVGIAVRVDSAGGALYQGARVGLGGRRILIHKFRTMSGGAPGPGITGLADRRVTRVGRLLRAGRVDELPQLWDVIRGEMLLVGPRPEAPAFVSLDDPAWKEILSVRPGITGRTQLVFADEAGRLDGPDVEAAYRAILPEKVASDLVYVRTRSLAGDLAILRDTVRFVIGRRRR